MALVHQTGIQPIFEKLSSQDQRHVKIIEFRNTPFKSVIF